MSSRWYESTFVILVSLCIRDIKKKLEVLQNMVASRAEEGDPIDFTTTNDWNFVELDVSQYDEVTIMVKNVGDTNSADIEVYSKANSAGQIEYKEYSATLAPGNVAKILLNGRYAKVILRAKSTLADNPTTLRVEWIGGK